MNTREMARKQELCQTLNMNFDEANELFSTETLSSMTMAKVNGGKGVGMPKEFWIELGITGASAIWDWFKNKPTPTPGSELTSTDDTIRITNFSADSVIIIRFDPITGNKISEEKYYNLSPMLPTPTPANGAGRSF